MAKEPEPPTFRALSTSQGDFGHECQSSCAMVATVYCHFLLESALRNPDCVTKSLSLWTAIGCWLFKRSLKELSDATSRNPTHTSPSLYTNPVTISRVVPEIGGALEAVEEYSGVLYTPNTQDPTIEAEFGIDGAFTSLEAVIARMAQVAEQRPVACTLITRENVHAISIRRTLSSQTLDPIEWGAAPEEALVVADILWTGQVHIDFVDSHRNSEATGMPDGRGRGVWIQFRSFSSLCAYLRARYPPESGGPLTAFTSVAPTLYTRRRNSFEACLWRSRPLGDSAGALFDLAQRLIQKPKFIAWTRRSESGRKRAREKRPQEPTRGVPNTRQRIEATLRRLEKNSDPTPG